MKKRRFVSTIFAAVASLAASAVSLIPANDSTVLYKDGSYGEKIFVGEADSASITLTADNEKGISDINVVPLSGKDPVQVTDGSFKIGTNKCYVLSYNVGNAEGNTEKVYLCYVKKSVATPTVKVCDYDSLTPVCDPNLKVQFSNLEFPNTYVNSRGETTNIKDNFVLSYIDYEADGIQIKEKQVEVEVDGVNDDMTLLISKPKRHTVFKLKDKLTKYEYVSDTFHTLLPFTAAHLTIDAEAIPHNTEKRGDDELVFGTMDEAKNNVVNNMFSGPLKISLERSSVDNTPADTVDATYVWSFYNDSTGVLRNRYRVRNNDMSLTDEPIVDYGTHYIVLACDNSVCKDTLVAGFKVKTSYIEMPYVFTPNGDGINDEFRPTYTSLAEYKIWIYNTMGKKMYESEDITIGWDGTHKGSEAPIGAYYYVVKAKGVDGVEYKLKGTVNLVRKAD